MHGRKGITGFVNIFFVISFYIAMNFSGTVRGNTGPFPEPDMVLSERVYNAGKVKTGATVRYVFLIENKGRGELYLENVRPTCGCTVAEYDKRIPPGGKGKIKALLNTTGFKGRINKTIEVTSNDPDEPFLILSLLATVYRVIDVLPNENVYFRTYRGESAVATRIIRRSDGKPFELKEIRTTLPELTIESAPPLGATASREFKLKMTLDGSIDRDNIYGKVTVKTDTEESETEIRIAGVILNDVSVKPKVLSMYSGRLKVGNARVKAKGAVVRKQPEAGSEELSLVVEGERVAIIEKSKSWSKIRTVRGEEGWILSERVKEAPASGITKKLFVSKRRAKDFEILDVKSDLDKLSFNVRALEVGKSYVVEVTWKRGNTGDGGKLRKGAIMIITNDKDNGEVVVPITIYL